MMRRCFIFSMVLAVFCVLSSDGFAASWDGTWSSSLGKMKINQKGNQVEGTYGSSGSIEGTVSGNVLKGTYRWSNKSGTFELKMSSDGKSFTGDWSRTGASGTWTGKRIGASGHNSATPKSTADSSISSWDGTWSSSLGEMKINQKGNQVEGTYGSRGSIEGTVSGNVLKGTYRWSNKNGTFELKMSSDGKSFTGDWSRTGASGTWTGKRIGASGHNSATPKSTTDSKGWNDKGVSTTSSHWVLTGVENDEKLWYDHSAYKLSYDASVAGIVVTKSNSSKNGDPLMNSARFGWSNIPEIIVPGTTYPIEIGAELIKFWDTNDAYSHQVWAMVVKWSKDLIVHNGRNISGASSGELICSDFSDISFENAYVCAETDQRIDNVSSRIVLLNVAENAKNNEYMYLTFYVQNGACKQFQYRWVE